MTQKTDAAVTVFSHDELAKLPQDVRERLNTQVTKTMKDVTARLPIIKISRETGQYMFPEDVLKSEFIGVILASNVTKSYWDKAYGGDNSPPTCASLDGVTPSQWEGDNPVSKKCGSCPMNKFGTAVDKDGNSTKGKACRDIRRVHILIDKEMFPYRLVLPPTSLYNYDDFVTRQTGKYGLPISLLVVNFSTEKAESDGYKVSKFKGDVVGNTFGNDPEKLIKALDKIERLQKEFDLAMHGQLIEADESDTTVTTAPSNEVSDTGPETQKTESEKTEGDKKKDGLPF
jgi:hypothetical protein